MVISHSGFLPHGLLCSCCAMPSYPGPFCTYAVYPAPHSFPALTQHCSISLISLQFTQFTLGLPPPPCCILWILLHFPLNDLPILDLQRQPGLLDCCHQVMHSCDFVLWPYGLGIAILVPITIVTQGLTAMSFTSNYSIIQECKAASVASWSNNDHVLLKTATNQ